MEVISVLLKVLMKLIKMLSQIKYSINIFYHVNLFNNLDLIKIVLKASDFYEYFYFLQVQLFPKLTLESIGLQFWALPLGISMISNDLRITQDC